MDPKQIQAESRCFKRMRKMQKKKTKKKGMKMKHLQRLKNSKRNENMIEINKKKGDYLYD
jgi:hypothetical protein